MLNLTRHTPGWQMILADLALILFLMTAAALSADQDLETETTNPIAKRSDTVSLAPAQALYRAGPDMPSLAQWLESQPLDPRASLTIVAEHTKDGEDAAWSLARSMASTAHDKGVRTRVILRAGEDNLVQASLAYDQPAP